MEIKKTDPKPRTKPAEVRVDELMDACPAEDSVARLRAWCDAGITAYSDGMALHDALYHDHHYHTRGNQDRDAVLVQILTILNHGSTFGAWQL